MSRVVVIVLLVVAIIASALTLSIGGCGENEEWSSCNGHCDNYCNLGPMACIMQCIGGCHCRDGYVRNKAHVCVLPENC